MTKIVAIDFETANNQMASVCSVGVAVMEDGVIIDHYYSLIKPEENVSYFSPYNIRVHGITAKDVEAAPAFSEIYRELTGYFEDAVLVAHNARFDMNCLKQTCLNTGKKIPVLEYFDTVELCKRVFSNLKHHRLNDVCDYIGIELDHHNALSDANGCLEIVMAVMNLVGEYDIYQLLERCQTKLYQL